MVALAEGAPDDSPLNELVCARCRVDFGGDQATPFFITSCSHTICANCLGPQPTPGAIVACPSCQTSCRTLLLELGSAAMAPVQHCFRPLRELVDELATAAEFQRANLVEQLAFFKDKRQVLRKLAAELSSLKGLKAKVEDLQRENASLRAQLASGQGSSSRPRAQAGQEDPEEHRKKRKAVDQPDRPETSQRQNAAGFFRPVLGPTVQHPERLSFSPSSISAQGEKRLRAKVNNSQQSSPSQAPESERARQQFAPARAGPTPLNNAGRNSAGKSPPTLYIA
ncbi:hypothetical protein RQP46_000766 [Phenoliferia psychrophenolica]